MQFEFGIEDVICFKCFWYLKGSRDEERVIRDPFCKWYEKPFNHESLKFKNRCPYFRESNRIMSLKEEISLPVVRKLRDA